MTRPYIARGLRMMSLGRLHIGRPNVPRGTRQPGRSFIHYRVTQTTWLRNSRPRSENLVITGSYDHSVRGWDLREAKAPVWTIDHGHPVNAVQLLPSGSMLATAGDRFIKIWDPVAGGRLVQTLSNHQKA